MPDTLDVPLLKAAPSHWGQGKPATYLHTNDGILPLTYTLKYVFSTWVPQRQILRSEGQHGAVYLGGGPRKHLTGAHQGCVTKLNLLRNSSPQHRAQLE